ncbi:MAG: ABC transporter ATP-binding protein [Phycisphaerales bacterium]|nr:ABC transporter ATP-binding protein [Phycisphaerales bacterium]
MAGCTGDHPAVERTSPLVTAAPVVKLQNVSFAYGAVPVVQDVSFALAPGDFACIVGPNGGGKTTLLRLMLGLLQPQSGAVHLFGRPPIAARRRIGYMPQYTQLDPQFPALVRDVVRMGLLHNWHLGPFFGRAVARADEALREVGMAEFARRPFAALSGGQRQRVLIARALACNPELLLLDEPTANLDPLVQDDMTQLLTQLNRRLTIVLVSHDVGFVARHVRTVICVNRTAVLHRAEEVTGDSIRALYGPGVQLVHHYHADHDHGHRH